MRLLPGAGGRADHIECRQARIDGGIASPLHHQRDDLLADRDSGDVVPQLKLGQLKDGADAIPSQAAGQWRINASGSTTGAEVYVGVLE